FFYQVWRVKACVLHAERSKDVLLDKHIESLPAQLVNQFAENDVVDIAVDEAGAWLRPRREQVDPLQGFVLPVAIIGFRVVGDQTTGVQQQLLDANLLLTCLAEGRKITANGVGQAE